MFLLEHKTFIIQSYFRNGEKQDNGQWIYSTNMCIADFREKFPNFPVTYQHVS